jgi:uncharacterized membrane protein YgcG
MNARLAILFCSALFAFACPCLATGSAPALDMRVKDFTAVMNPSYTEELNWRLARYAEDSGYDIYIALVANQNEFTALTAPLLRSRALEKSWSKGFVLLSISSFSRHTVILTSDNLRERFYHSRIIEEIEQIVEVVEKKYTTMDGAVEYAVEKIIDTIDPWFYVLPPPREFPRGFFHSETTEVILLGFAPLSAFMFAIALMAFTSAGGLGILKRLAICGVYGLIIAIAEAFLLRQPGGISPAGLYYSGIAGFTVAAAVGALKPFWFEDKFSGKKSDAWWSGPVLVHWG